MEWLIPAQTRPNYNLIEKTGTDKDDRQKHFPPDKATSGPYLAACCGVCLPARSEVGGELQNGTQRVFYKEGGNLSSNLSGHLVQSGPSFFGNGMALGCATHFSPGEQFKFGFADGTRQSMPDISWLNRMALINNNPSSPNFLRLEEYLMFVNVSDALAEAGIGRIGWLDHDSPYEGYGNCDVVVIDQKVSNLLKLPAEFVELARVQPAQRLQ